MIKFVRLDERLIHGQVATKWIKQFNITHVIVANDSIAKNELLKKTLMMAAPKETKVAIETIKKTVLMLKNPKSNNANIMLIVNNPKDAFELIELIPEIKEINIGNFGRNATNEESSPRKPLSKNVYVNDSERKQFKDLVNTGKYIYFQTVPEEPQINMADLLGGKN